MCGIFTILNYLCSGHDEQFHEENFMKSKNRGPDNSRFKAFDFYNYLIGFHRLCINGLDDISNQPIIYDKIILMCNGEIYNYKDIYNSLDIKPTTNSDCEVIIHLYLKFKDINYVLNLLDGVFSFVLFDFNDNIPICYVARDPFGVRPLYNIIDNDDFTYGFSSELKSLSQYSSERYNVKQFEPATYS
jgi:asparagine synthase (glutamine-hydrolysing)